MHHRSSIKQPAGAEPPGIDKDSEGEYLNALLAAEAAGEGFDENEAKGHLESSADDVKVGLHDDAMFAELERFI